MAENSEPKAGGIIDVRKDEKSLMNTVPQEQQQKLLLEEKRQLEKEIKVKEDRLRKLKMAELYRKKDELHNLDDLITKWRQAAQEILADLQNALPEPKPSISDLLKSLQIDAKLLKYNETDETFY